MNKKLHELNNGLQLLTVKDDNTKFASIKIAVKVGAIDETKENYGISHFLEHLLFTGTDKRDEQGLQRELSMYAGNYNAYTFKICTMLLSDTLVEDFENTLDVFSDMLMNSKISEESVDKERNVILSELNLCKEDTIEYGWDVVNEIAYKDTPLANSILGYEEQLNSLTAAKIKEYYKKFYVPNNTIISIISPLEHDEVLEKINKFFGSWEKSYESLPERNLGDTMVRGTHEINIGASNQESIYVVFDCNNLTFKENTLLTIIANRLGGGMSSILWRKLRNELGITYSTYAGFSGILNKGSFYAFANTDPEHTEKGVQAIKEAIEEVLTQEGCGNNLDIAKKEIVFEMAMSLEDNSRTNSILIENMINNKPIDFYDEYTNIVKSATTDELLEVAQKVLKDPCIIVSKAIDE